MLREATLTHIRTSRSDGDWLGISLAAAGGLCGGFVAGLFASELLGTIDGDRMRRTLRRLRRRGSPRHVDPGTLASAVLEALGRHPATQGLRISAIALGEGIVELTGTAPDDATRRLATTTSRRVPGVSVVVNRILIEDRDLQTTSSHTS